MEYTKIGQLLKPVGTQGEIKVNIDDKFWDDFVENDHFFIKINGCFVPYFIEDIKEKNHLLLKIEEVDTPEQANDFNLKEMYLRAKDIQSKSGTDYNTFTGLEHYVIFDGKTQIGTIQSIEEYPQQIMAHVLVENKTLLIPIVDDLIDNIDHDTKTIIMQLPEGLVDI